MGVAELALVRPPWGDEAARIVRFGAVGLVNTAIGAGVIALALRAGLGDYAANASGYALGLVSSYALNRRFTFRAGGAGTMAERGRFLLTALIAYAVNLAILALGRSTGLGGTMVLQLAAMGAYTLAFYALSRRFVFGEEWRFDPLALADSNLLVAALVLATALPALLPPVLPLMDLGGHLGRYVVQVDGGRSADLAQWYGFRWGLLPNLGVDLLVQALAPLLGVEAAMHLVVGLIPPLTVLGLLLLARAAHGRIPPSAPLAVPLALGMPYLYGFANFTLGMALALLALALWLQLGARGRIGLRAVLFVPIGFALWLCHLVPFAVFAIVAGCIELDRRRAEGHRLLPALVLSGLPLLGLLAGPLAGLALPHRPDPGPPFEYIETRSKAAFVFMVLRDAWPAWDAVCTGALVFAVVTGLRAPGWVRHRGLVGAGLLLAAIYAIMPDVIMGSHYADLRLIPVVLILLLVGMAPTVTDQRRAALILALALGFAGVRLAGSAVTLTGAGTRWAQDLTVLDSLPRGRNMVSLFVAPCQSWGTDRRHHLSGYALARRHGFDNGQWEMPSGQLLSVHNRDAEPFVRDPSQVTFATPCRGAADVGTTVAAIPPRIAWLWVIAGPSGREYPGWHLVRAVDDSHLYRRD